MAETGVMTGWAPSPGDDGGSELAAVDTKQAAEHLGLSRSKVAELLRGGWLAGHKADERVTAPWVIDLRPEVREWRSYTEAARLLGLDKQTVKQLVRDGRVPNRSRPIRDRVGRPLVIPTKEGPAARAPERLRRSVHPAMQRRVPPSSG